MTDDSTRSNKEQAVAAQLGRAVWFSLESSARAASSSLWSDRFATAAAAHPDLQSRQDWTPTAWTTFWTSQGGLEIAKTVFLQDGNDDDDATTPDKELLDAMAVYLDLYQTLPGVPDNGGTIKDAVKRVDQLLGAFQDRLGDPVMACQVCRKNATGSALKRCSRCKQSYYCSQACQKADWPTHKRSCQAPNLKILNKLVSARYTELRRQGKQAKQAMSKARSEYGMMDQNQPNAGAQVAAMFGMPM